MYNTLFLSRRRPWTALVPSVSPARVFFGDKRLDDRLESTFNEMAKRPAGTLPQKLPGRAELVGGYRMFNNPKVTHAAVLAAHRASCLARLEGYTGKILVLHDTSTLDYSGLDVDGLGQVGDGHGKGLLAHNSLAILPETREVAGLLNQILHKRADVPKGESKKSRAQRPDRESGLWKRAVQGLPAMPPGARVTDVSDRGSDLSEYICCEVAAGREFIVRSQHNRKLVDQGEPSVMDDESETPQEGQARKLHELLRALPPAGQYTLRVPADAGGWREAVIGVAFAKVNVLPPRQARGEHGREPVEVFGVIARETGTPPGRQKPVEWILLTNRPVATVEQAREVVEDYACRWMIEDYHKAMKSGCGIEDMQLTTLQGLSAAIAVQSVLAVHVLRLRCKARDEQTKGQPARLHEEELKVRLAARDSKHPDWRAMTLFEFYIAVARMGGYVLNPQKRPPGWMILWRGYVRLEDMCEGVRLMGERCVQT